jgi:hypothetical protein
MGWLVVSPNKKITLLEQQQQTANFSEMMIPATAHRSVQIGYSPRPEPRLSTTCLTFRIGSPSPANNNKQKNVPSLSQQKGEEGVVGDQGS